MQLQDEVISSDAERLRMIHSNVKMVTCLHSSLSMWSLLVNQHGPPFKGNSSSLSKFENNILEKEVVV
jgi:hypothetical protein